VSTLSDQNRFGDKLFEKGLRMREGAEKGTNVSSFPRVFGGHKVSFFSL
jgi:hypothetical protein